MAIYRERLFLEEVFPFQTLMNDGDILTTPHWHQETEMIYVKTGRIRMGIGEDVFVVEEGEFVLIAGGRVHYVLASPGSVRYVYQFDERFFCDLTRDQYGLHSLRELWRSYPVHSKAWEQTLQDEVRGCLDQIFEEDQSRKTGYMFAVKGAMCFMVLAMYRNQEVHRNESAYEYRMETSGRMEKLNQIFEYVEEHYSGEITLEDISEYAGFSTFYFTKFFKRNVGKTFLHFLNEYRIEKAKWILLNEETGTMELIERIGIGSTKTYYRLFKEIVGISPGEYRKRSREDNI